MSLDRLADLLDLVRRVRRRWRARRALQGVAVQLMSGLVLVVAGGGWLTGPGLSATTVLALRLVGWVILAGVLFRGVTLPLARRISPSAG